MNEPMKMSEIFLQLHLMIAPSGSERRRGLSYWIRWIFVVLGSITFTFIPLFISIYYEYKNKVWIRIYSSLADIVSFLGGSVAYMISISSQRQIVLILRDIPNLEKNDQPHNFSQTSKRLNILSCLHYGYITAAFIARLIVNHVNLDICNKDNEFFKYEISCGLLSTLALPFEWKSGSWKLFFGIGQFVFTFIPVKGASATPYLLYEFASFIEIRIEQLNKMIYEIFESEFRNVQRTNLVDCIEYYRNLHEHAQKLNKAFSRVMFTHLTMTAAVLGVLSNLIMKRLHQDYMGLLVFADIMHLFAWFVSLLLSCYAGEKITHQCEMISSKLYESKWYNSEVILQKEFHIFHRIALRRVVLTSGPFGTLSYPLFVAIVKSAYSYVALLQRRMK